MRTRSVVLVWCLVWCWCLIPSNARADAKPWVPMQDGSIHLVAEPMMDLHARLWLIQNAKKSLDIISYEQGDDHAVGLPVLQALRDAGNRGVKVRIITHWLFQYLTHPFNQSPSFCTNPPTKTPIEYVVFGSPMSAITNGWRASDGIHGKLLIMDGQLVLTSGRNQAHEQLHWIDATFLLKGPLVQQSQEAFDTLWAETRDREEPYEPTFARTALTEEQTQSAPVPVTPAEREQIAAMEAWAKAPLGPVVQGSRVRLLHHDFVHQMEQLKKRNVPAEDTKDRLALLNDPVVDAAVDLVEQTHPGETIRFTAMYAMLHPRFEAALVAAAARKVKVILFTNGEFLVPPITTVAWRAGTGSLQALANAGAEIVTFVPRSGLPWVFLHLKVLLAGNTVLLGSHNLNLPSSLFNDEMNYEVEDPAFARMMTDLFDSHLKTSGEHLDTKAIGGPESLRTVAWWIMDPMLGWY